VNTAECSAAGSRAATRELYRKLCDAEPSIPIFSKHWWLDSVCTAGHWDAAVIQSGNEVVAALPYYVKTKALFKIQTMPPLTQNLGLWMRYPANCGDAERTEFEIDIMREIIKKLPKVSLTNINMHYSSINHLAFQWAGFEETARYTYVVDGLRDLGQVFSRFDAGMRNKVRKADKIVKTMQSEDIRAFFDIGRKTFERQGVGVPYSFEFLRRHDAVLRDRAARTIFLAADRHGHVHSALYLTWDSTSSYVHLAGEDPQLRSSGAGIKLIWDAIQYTSSVLKLDQLDFEGSMIESIERVRRNCGGVQRRYSNLRRFANRGLKMLYRLRQGR
jgi:hypothetical protein